MNEENNGCFKERIGKTLYLVNVRSANSAKETYETKMRKMLKNAVNSGFFPKN